MSIFHRSEDPAGREGGRHERDRDDARVRAEQRLQDQRDPQAEARADEERDRPADTRADYAAVEADERGDDRPTVVHGEPVGGPPVAYRDRAGDVPLDQRVVVERQRERYGGVKVGAAFFGWLTATGIAVLLTALLVAAGPAVGVARNTEAGKAVGQAAQNVTTVGLAGGIALLVILFIAYYCGGYVAGRMARFNGATQGVAVWVVALVIAIGVAVLGVTAGSKYNVLATLNSFPRIPVDEGTLTRGGVIALLLAAVVSLVGAILGGLAGMRYHRRVDSVGLAA
jgi:hypothetical protein